MKLYGQELEIAFTDHAFKIQFDALQATDHFNGNGNALDAFSIRGKTEMAGISDIAGLISDSDGNPSRNKAG